MPGVIEQNVFIRFDDPDPVILEMFLQPISLHQRFRMCVFSRVSSHIEISAGPRTEQGISLCQP